jgi:uncharacterized protein YeaC (DUF1315 family)
MEKRILEQEQRTSGMDNDELDGDLDDQQCELKLLNQALEEVKENVACLQKDFDAEAAKPENSKADGQPMRHTFEQLLKPFDINFADFHGREMQGNQCIRFLYNQDKIIEAFQKYVLTLPDIQKRERDDKVTKHMFEMHRRLLGHVDAGLSFLHTERDEIDIDAPEVAVAERHIAQAETYWQYLKLSETPKNHCFNCHGMPCFRRTRGFFNLGKDSGKRAHQDGAQEEKRLQAMLKYEEKENAKALYQSMAKNPEVVQKQRQMQEARRRVFKKENRVTAAQRQLEAREQRQEGHDELLELPEPTDKYITLRERKKARILEGRQ